MVLQYKRMQRAQRVLMVSFATAIALLLGLWSWASLASSASLTVTPTSARQNDIVTLVGQGFSPGETIAIWITYPDFRVYGVAEIVANDDGSFSYPYLPDFLGATFTPTGKYTYTAHGKSSEREVYADLAVSIGAAPSTTVGVQLTAEPGKDSQGSYFVFRGSGYHSSEEVAIWIRYPDNTVADLGRTTAGPSGLIEYVMYVTGVPVGHYAFTARGIESMANGVAEFDVAIDDLTIATGKATLNISSSPDTQRSYATFSGSGFRPKEVVTIWVTLPDYSTRWISDVTADANGAFNAVLYLSEREPVGQRSYTAYGNSSGLKSVVSYALKPGSGDASLAPASSNSTMLEPDAICTGQGCF